MSTPKFEGKQKNTEDFSPVSQRFMVSFVVIKRPVLVEILTITQSSTIKWQYQPQ